VLSGGQRRRVEVVRILFAGSDVLLLDEPTNHLDADAKAVDAVDFLAWTTGARCIVISHDLDLLDEAITRVIHLDRGGDDGHVGTMVRVQGHLLPVPRGSARPTRSGWPSRSPMQAKEIDRLQTIVDRFGAKATKASMAHSLEKRIDRLKARRRPSRGSGPEGPQAQAPRAAALPPARCWRRPSWRSATPGSRCSRTSRSTWAAATVCHGHGPQRRRQDQSAAGAGRTITDAGDRFVPMGHAACSVGYYAQEHEGIRRRSKTCVDHMREASDRSWATASFRSLLGMFGLVGDKVFQDASTLSGGEKTKLALAQLVAGKHNVLLLDEPTNNLDPGSRDRGGRARCREWGGTLIVVSHDAEFVEALDPDRACSCPTATSTTGTTSSSSW
jgi:ATPase subunit of ABC transporter with duplicated ATPase domains